MESVSGVLSISSECAAAGLKGLAIVFEGVTIAASPEELRASIKAACEELREKFRDLHALRESPGLAAFRQAHAALGVNARREAPGCQRLLEAAWKHGDLPRINTLVDAYNLVSIRHTLSIGAHDLPAITLPVSLRRVNGEATFIPLGAAVPKVINCGDFAYVDAGDRVICHRDIIQAEFSRITTRSSNAYVIIEGTVGHEPHIFEAARRDLIDFVARYSGGTATT